MPCECSARHVLNDVDPLQIHGCPCVFGCSHLCGTPGESSYLELILESPMSSEARNRPRVETLSRTCDTCKFRHQKCNGVKPTCHHCASRGLQCNYSNTQANKINPATVRRKVLAPHSYNSSSLSLQRSTFDTGALTLSAANTRSIIYETLVAGLVRCPLCIH